MFLKYGQFGNFQLKSNSG